MTIPPEALQLSSYRIWWLPVAAIISSIGLFSIAGWVLRLNPRSRLHKSFFHLALLSGLIALFEAIRGASTGNVSIFWTHIIWIWVILIPIVILKFQLRLFKDERLLEIMMWILIPVTTIFLIIHALGLFYQGNDAAIAYSWATVPQYALLGKIFIVIYASIFLLAMVRSWQRLRSLEKGSREWHQIRVNHIAFLSIATLTSLDFFQYFGIGLFPMSYFFLLGWVGMQAYAIVKYQLYQIDDQLTLSGVINVMPGYLFVLGKNGRVHRANKNAIKLLGDKNIRPAGIILWEVIQATESFCKKLLFTEVEDIEAVQKQDIVYEGDGGVTMNLALSGQTVRGHDGEIVGAVIIAEDFTELKDVIEEISRQNKHVSQDMEDIEKMNKILVGRENEMVKLKEKIRDLEEKNKKK